MTDWFARRLNTWLEQLRTGGVAPLPPVEVAANPPPYDWAPLPERKRVLHVGCGHARQDRMPGEFKELTWAEVRLDGDPEVAPDIEASMTEMPQVPDGAVNAVYSSHGIEHLYWHDVPLAFAEFLRVLSDDGFFVVTCPDLQAAAEMIAEDRLFEPAYESPAGTITPFDIVYSYRPFVEANPRWMSHHCGFTLTSLNAKLRESGFVSTCGFRRGEAFDLWVLATKTRRTEAELLDLGQRFLPWPIS